MASQVYLQSGNDEEDLQVIREATEKDPTNYIIYVFLSLLEMLRGNRDEAQELALLAAEYYVEGGPGRLYVAYSLALAGFQDAAIDFSPTLGGLGGGQIMDALVRGDRQRALDTLNEWVETRSTFGPGFVMMATNGWRDPVLDESDFAAARVRFREALLD